MRVFPMNRQIFDHSEFLDLHSGRFLKAFSGGYLNRYQSYFAERHIVKIRSIICHNRVAVLTDIVWVNYECCKCWKPMPSTLTIESLLNLPRTRKLSLKCYRSDRFVELFGLLLCSLVVGGARFPEGLWVRPHFDPTDQFVLSFYTFFRETEIPLK